MIEVVEVKTKKQLKQFAKYPLELYKGCPYYVPSLLSDELATFNPKKNFNLKDSACKGFLCYKDGKLVGRIAGLISKKDNELRGKKMIRFSRFECIDDIEVFKALLSSVEKFGAENGMEIIHGPWGFNDTDREGMLTYGFDRRSTYSTNYYYPYFAENMKKLGYADESKWLERDFPVQKYDRISKISEKLTQKLGVTDVSDTMSVKKILKLYGDKMFETLNDAYGELDGYIPIEGKARENVLSQFATIVNVKYISFLVDKKGDVAAFGITLPSIADALIKHKGRLFPFGFIDVLKAIHRPKQMEMALIGVKKEYKNSGINAIVIAKIINSLYDGGIKSIESNPMLETNLNIQQQWKFAENEIIKRRQTFTKPIGE